jgi:hypothetical protein
MRSGACKGRPCGTAGEVDRIRSGYYPALFYPKIGRLATNLLPQMTTVYYIHNFKGSGGGAHLLRLRVIPMSVTLLSLRLWDLEPGLPICHAVWRTLCALQSRVPAWWSGTGGLATATARV